jgi:hypothetical protein
LSLELRALLSGVTDHLPSEVLGKSDGTLVLVHGLNALNRFVTDTGLVDNGLERKGISVIAVLSAQPAGET